MRNAAVSGIISKIVNIVYIIFLQRCINLCICEPPGLIAKGGGDSYINIRRIRECQ